MQFKVTGSSKSTGGRMDLQVEAKSKHEAQRKAEREGMVVSHVDQISGTTNYTGPVKTGGGLPIIPIIIVLALAAAAYFFWPQIKALIPGLH